MEKNLKNIYIQLNHFAVQLKLTILNINYTSIKIIIILYIWGGSCELSLLASNFHFHELLCDWYSGNHISALLAAGLLSTENRAGKVNKVGGERD